MTSDPANMTTLREHWASYQCEVIAAGPERITPEMTFYAGALAMLTLVALSCRGDLSFEAICAEVGGMCGIKKES